MKRTWVKGRDRGRDHMHYVTNKRRIWREQGYSPHSRTRRSERDRASTAKRASSSNFLTRISSSMRLRSASCTLFMCPMHTRGQILPGGKECTGAEGGGEEGRKGGRMRSLIKKRRTASCRHTTEVRRKHDKQKLSPGKAYNIARTSRAWRSLAR